VTLLDHPKCGQEQPVVQQPAPRQHSAQFWEKIHAAKRRELTQLLNPATAARMAKWDIYGRLGDWLPQAKPGDRVLELGCGSGHFVALLGSLGFTVTGVDPCNYPEWTLIRERTTATLMDNVYAEDLPFDDGSFDHVTSLAAFHYYSDPAKALAEIKRVLKPGGKLVIKSVNRDNLYTLRTGAKLDPSSKNLYTMGELVQFVQEKGFVVQDRYAFGYMPSFWTDYWWYFLCVWAPNSLQQFLSNRLRPECRHNNYVLATPTA
jgi:SAM-dependent methyltransferase